MISNPKGIFLGKFDFEIFFRKVSTEEGVDKAKVLEALFVETSARNGTGIQELFKNVTQILLNGEVEPEKEEEEKGQQLDAKNTGNTDGGKKKSCKC